MEGVRRDVKHAVQDVVAFRAEEAALRERKHLCLRADLQAGEG